MVLPTSPKLLGFTGVSGSLFANFAMFMPIVSSSLLPDTGGVWLRLGTGIGRFHHLGGTVILPSFRCSLGHACRSSANASPLLHQNFAVISPLLRRDIRQICGFAGYEGLAGFDKFALWSRWFHWSRWSCWLRKICTIVSLVSLVSLILLASTSLHYGLAGFAGYAGLAGFAKFTLWTRWSR